MTRLRRMTRPAPAPAPRAVVRPGTATYSPAVGAVQISKWEMADWLYASLARRLAPSSKDLLFSFQGQYAQSSTVVNPLVPSAWQLLVLWHPIVK